jgi:DNA-binding winged helix-turn-helix (wHTH) protein
VWPWCDSEALQVGGAAGEIQGKFGGIGVSARFGGFTLDADRRQLTSEASGELHLTPKAFDLLALLVAEAPRVVRKGELHERLWPGTFVSDATLVGLVKEIRRALDDRDSAAPLIRTAHGVGYAFSGELQAVIAPRSDVSRWIVAGGRRIPLADGENLIGRDPSSAVCLDATGVSRCHARIVIGRGGAKLEDLGSKNGTRLGDSPVTGSVGLHDGDRIHIGPILVIYHASASGMSTETISHTASDG